MPNTKPVINTMHCTYDSCGLRGHVCACVLRVCVYMQNSHPEQVGRRSIDIAPKLNRTSVELSRTRHGVGFFSPGLLLLLLLILFVVIDV